MLESSLHLGNSRKHFHRCTAFGAVDYDIGKKATFCAATAIFHRSDKKCIFSSFTAIFSKFNGKIGLP